MPSGNQQELVVTKRVSVQFAYLALWLYEAVIYGK